MGEGVLEPVGIVCVNVEHRGFHSPWSVWTSRVLEGSWAAAVISNVLTREVV